MEVKKGKTVQKVRVPEVWMGAGANVSMIYPLGSSTKISLVKELSKTKIPSGHLVQLWQIQSSIQINVSQALNDICIGDQSIFPGRYSDVEATSVASGVRESWVTSSILLPGFDFG